jgi:type III secretory pathway lipoprotein EscJ
VIEKPLQSVHFVAQKNSNALNSSCSYEESIPLESFIDINNSIYSKDIKNLINKCIIHGLEDTFITY